jgi:Xaa-Pro aminopeptidase
MLHSVGLEEESPSVAHPGDAQPNPDREIRPGMALVVECYLGEVGAREGIKLGDEILVTDGGTERLAPFHFDDALLA